MRRFPAGGYLLGYLLVVTAVITLAPFRFAGPVEPRVAWLVNPGDVVANVLLFVPLGFLYRISAHPAARPGHWPTIGAALLVSATLETLQIFLPAVIRARWTCCPIPSGPGSARGSTRASPRISTAGSCAASPWNCRS